MTTYRIQQKGKDEGEDMWYDNPYDVGYTEAEAAYLLNAYQEGDRYIDFRIVKEEE